jgi:cyanophycinase
VRSPLSALLVTAVACGGGGGNPAGPNAASNPGAPAASPSAPPALRRYLTGNPADATLPALRGPAHDLGGGGLDVDPAIQWMVDSVRGCSACAARADVVVLRASGSDGYNGPIAAMDGVDSVETLVFAERGPADDPAVEETVQAAEVVFFAGGDQCDYVRRFRGTRLHAAVDAVQARGGGVGGTSAGLAILGEFVYDACTGSVDSGQALADPYHRAISFTRDFFAWPQLQGVLFDTHFAQRDRMGRLVAFLARQIQDGAATRAVGVGVSEGTSLILGPAGVATVMGDGPVHVVLAEHPPEVCRAGTALTYMGLRHWRLGAGDRIDLQSLPGAGWRTLDVIDGRLDPGFAY